MPLCPLQIHDELLFEVKETHVHQAAAVVRRVMEGQAANWGLRAPLPVRIQQGPSWGELQEYQEPPTAPAATAEAAAEAEATA